MHSRERTWDQGNFSQWKDTNNISNKPRVQTKADDASEKKLDPIKGSTATAKFVAKIMNLLVDDLFETSGTEMEQRVPARLREKISKLTRKTGMMWLSQDKELVGLRILGQK